MNKYSLLFNNQTQENQYRQYIKDERGKALQIIVTLQSFNEFIILSTVVYYFLSDLNNFGDALDFIIYQVMVFVINALLAILMYFKLLNYGITTHLFILLHIIRVTLNVYLPGYFEHQLQFFSQFQYGYSCFLIIIIVTLSYHFIFKAVSILMLNSVVFFLIEYAYNNFYTMFFISAVLCCKVFSDEKTCRQDFLVKQKMEKWMLIVDRVIPSSVFITKFNPREETIELSQSNQKAKTQFDVKNSEQFQNFIARTFLDKNSEETAAQKNNLPPNNLKVRIRNLIEKERVSTQKKAYQRKMIDGVQKLKTVQDNKFAAMICSNQNMIQSYQSQSRNRAESRNSQRSDSNYQGSPILQSISRKPSNFNQPNSALSANLNNIPLPFRNIVLKSKMNRENSNPGQKFQLDSSVQHNDSFISVSHQQITHQQDSDLLNQSCHSQPVLRKGRKAKTIKNRQQIFKKNDSNASNIQSPDNEGNTQNDHLLLGYYRKDELSEQQTFSIKLHSYYLEEIYVIVVIDEESYEEKLIREKNKLRELQINGNRFVNELSQLSRNMFSELRSQQIYYLNEQQLLLNHGLMKEMNMRAINHCFGIINNIDNYIICHNQIATAILEDEIKEVDLNQLIDNLLKVLQIQKEERHIKCILYNTYKKSLNSSSKYITQLLFNLLNLSFQACAEQGLIQIEIRENNKSYYTSYIEICIKHTLKEDSFSIFNFCEQQRMVFETSKKLLELISPYSKFFIKQRKQFYAQIKFYLYKDLNEIHLLNKTRQTVMHHGGHNILANGGGNHLIEQEDCMSDDLSIELTNPCINKIDSLKETNKNTRNYSKILSNPTQNTETKFSQEFTEEDNTHQEGLSDQKLQSKNQINQITSSVFVEGISGYKIPFGRLFSEGQKQQKNTEYDDDDEFEDDENDYEEEDEHDENQKTEQESSMQNSKLKRQISSKTKQKKSRQNSPMKLQKEFFSKNEDKKSENNSLSQFSKKRLSSRLETRNTSQKSQNNIRSKKNSCFNENSSEPQKLYFQDIKNNTTIKETDEEVTKSLSSKNSPNNFNMYLSNQKNGIEEQELNKIFTLENKTNDSRNDRFRSKIKDEIKEVEAENNRSRQASDEQQQQQNQIENNKE